jgi:hypothetical protein
LDSDLGRGLFLRFLVTGVWGQIVFEGLHVLKCAPLCTAVGARKLFSFSDPVLRNVSKVVNENHHDLLMGNCSTFRSFWKTSIVSLPAGLR